MLRVNWLTCILPKQNLPIPTKKKKRIPKRFNSVYFITFCELANYAGNTIYKKLSEQGQKERKDKVLEAASSAQVVKYSDPSNPKLTGVIKPSAPYVETADNRECVDMEDTLADESESETIYIKYCRSLPNGKYTPVTA